MLTIVPALLLPADRTSEWLSSLVSSLAGGGDGLLGFSWSFPSLKRKLLTAGEGGDKKRLRLINWGRAWTRTNLHLEHGWGCEEEEELVREEEEEKKMGEQFRQIMAAIGLLTILASSGKKGIFCSLPIQFGHFIELLVDWPLVQREKSAKNLFLGKLHVTGQWSCVKSSKTIPFVGLPIFSCPRE